MNNDPGVILRRLRDFPSCQEPVGVLTVDDVDLVSSAREFTGEPLDEDPVAAKTLGR
jgi:hypothetical protein